jgi:hypothetical protein
VGAHHVLVVAAVEIPVGVDAELAEYVPDRVECSGHVIARGNQDFEFEKGRIVDLRYLDEGC